MPITRYEESLRREGKLNSYYKLLKENFNENNLENLMCKKTISVNWLGEIYDCDFNPVSYTHLTLPTMDSV